MVIATIIPKTMSGEIIIIIESTSVMEVSDPFFIRVKETNPKKIKYTNKIDKTDALVAKTSVGSFFLSLKSCLI